MTLDEVAEFLRVHPSTVYRLLKKGGIPAFKMGSDWRFNQASVEQWVRERESYTGREQYPARRVCAAEAGDVKRRATTSDGTPD